MIDFECGCPVAGCPNNKKLLKWNHDDCGATETIDSEGIVKCRNGHNLGEFFSFKYSCGEHDSKYGSYPAFLAALSICSNFDAEFAFKLTQKLMDAYKDGRIPSN